MTTPAQTKAWFDAADRFDTKTMQALLDAGVSVNTASASGRTALFSMMAPWGGRPEGVAWLIERGADVNVRDAKGVSAVQLGHAHVTSGLEANMARHNAHLCRSAGYIDDVTELRQVKSRSRRKRRAPPPEPRTAAFFGHWRVAEGDDAGAEVHVTTRGITSALPWIGLRSSGHMFSPSGQMRFDGSHAGKLVHVRLETVEDGRIRLVRNDGQAPVARVMLARPPE